MFREIVGYLAEGVVGLAQALETLAPAAIVFLALGWIVKRGALWAHMTRAFGEGVLNLKLGAFNLILVAPGLGAVAAALEDAAHGRGWHLIPPDAWSAAPDWVVILVAVLAGDFIGYWRHRLEHTRVLWPSHAVHHSDTAMTFLTLNRFHPINRVTTVLIDAAFLLALGLPPFAIAANLLVRHAYGQFIHADLPWTYGPLGRVFVSPAMHRWHHADDPRFYHANFATVFSVFDQAFGTYKVPGPCAAPLGVSDPMPPTLAGQLGYAFTARAYRVDATTPSGRPRIP
jgi:sterol desaturase/sphingolipid hydroxylase (fatty acid hydroxylase superfamily)